MKQTLDHHNKAKKRVAKLGVLLVSAALLAQIKVPALAVKSHYYSNIGDSGIEDLFEVKLKDAVNAFQWIEQQENFTLLEKRGEEETYWWNVPNVQSTLFNMMYDNIMISGYGDVSGKDPAEDNTFNKVDVAGENGADNAMERYGFHLQNPTYYGERPLVTMSLLGVLAPDSVFDGLGRVGSFIMDNGQIVGLPTDKDLNSLLYVAPRDYNIAGNTFMTWVDENWFEAVKNIDPGQILLSNADAEDGMYKDKQWVAKNIIFDKGLDDPSLTAEEVCEELEVICGSYYSNVAQNIILCSGCTEVHHYERMMPWDLKKLNAEDVKMFDGVDDPRSQMQRNVADTGYANIALNFLANKVLGVSSALAETSVLLNRFCTLSALDSIGFNPLLLWDASLVDILLVAVGVAFVLLAVKSAFEVVRGKKGAFHIVSKLVSTLLVAGFLFGLSVNPEKVWNGVKDVSNSIFALGNVVLPSNQSLTPLYANTDQAGVEDVNLWLPYFNSWALYQTNHTILDQEQLVEMNGHPEEKNLVMPNIDGVEQNLWCTVLADASATSKAYSGDVYRMVDHFMAPRVDMHDITAVDFDTHQNENWNGNIQSRVHWGVIPLQLLLMAVVLVKVLLFVEFLVNFSMLLVNTALAVTNGKQVVRLYKRLGASCLNVMLANVVLQLVVWISLMVENGGFSLVISLFLLVVMLQGMKRLVFSNSVFSPQILNKPIILIRRKVSALFAPTGERKIVLDPEKADESFQNCQNEKEAQSQHKESEASTPQEGINAGKGGTDDEA